MGYFGRETGFTIPASVKSNWMRLHWGQFGVLVSTAVGLIGGYYVGFVLGDGDPTFMAVGLFMMVLFPAIGVLMSMVMNVSLQAPLWPVLLYQDGLEVHQFTFDRLTKKRSFLPVTDIARVSVKKFDPPRGSDATRMERVMAFYTGSRKEYWIGPRDEHDVEGALKYIRKEWPSVWVDADGVSTAHGLRNDTLVQIPAPLPLMTDREGARPYDAPVIPPVHPPQPAYVKPIAYPAPIPPAPTMRFCPYCGGGMPPGARFCPACGRQHGAYVPPPQAPVAVGRRKSVGTATALGLVPGLLGILGLGQFYVGKYALGALLLIVGGFCGLMGFSGIILFLDPTYQYAETAVMLFLVVAFNLIFLVLLSFSVIDARRTAAGTNMGF